MCMEGNIDHLKGALVERLTHNRLSRCDHPKKNLNLDIDFLHAKIRRLNFFISVII